MSGADESNEDLVSGRVNRSNDTTRIWAENEFTDVSIGPIGLGEFRTPFNGSVIFQVEVAGDSDDEGEFRPDQPLDAIVGVGWSAEFAGQSGGTGVTGLGGEVGGTGIFAKGGQGGTGLRADAGGGATGVVGLGGPDEGTGVFGLGSGGDRLLRHGRGGTGVHGVGGHALVQPGPADVPPGTGVFGQGGRILEENTGRLLLGTGVIGVGGDAGNKDLPPTSEAGSAGVFGQGADAQLKSIVDASGGSVFDGPAEPGAGVIGRGGVADNGRLRPAAGVVGLAGGQSKPDNLETGDAGVFGLGDTGVRGHGLDGPGVAGSSKADRGGVFATDDQAQVNLVPRPVRTKLPEGSAVTPTAISSGELERGLVSLPRRGRPGDLMTLIDDAQLCTLWFCVRGADDGGPARWAQVLLGPEFPGQA